ncbi:MAG: hypothetical protein SCALA702_35720 [Melioribacteraceae bacterium]|nr:MAG: hypothetical protein SCALA702_35720 [Melioribacteraceae bacterium]
MFRSDFDKKDLTDSGMALALLFTLLMLWKDYYFLSWGVGGVLLAAMTFPKILYPWALIWFNLSIILGTVSSKILLSIVYFLVLTPTAIVKKLRGYDPMKIKPFKKGSDTVFVERNHNYIKSDLEKTY